MTEGLDFGGYEWEGISTKRGKSLFNLNSRQFAEHVIKKASSFDTVLIGKGSTITMDVLRTITENCDTTYWTPDSVGGDGCGPPGRPKEVGARGLLCSRIICTGTEGARWFRRNGYTGRLAQIYQGCRHRIWKPGNYPRQNQSRLAFLGTANYNGDGGRRLKFQAIKNAGMSLFHSRRIFHEEAAGIYWNSAICPNFVCGDITSNRLTRILASGGFCLTEGNADIDHSFTDGKEVAMFPFQNIPKMIEKIQYFMARPELRDEIAMRGHEWTKDKSWNHQMEKMVRFIGGEDVPADGAADKYVGTFATAAQSCTSQNVKK